MNKVMTYATAIVCRPRPGQPCAPQREAESLDTWHRIQDDDSGHVERGANKRNRQRIENPRRAQRQRR